MADDVNDGTALLYDPVPMVDTTAGEDVRFKRGTIDRHLLGDDMRRF